MVKLQVYWVVFLLMFGFLLEGQTIHSLEKKLDFSYFSSAEALLQIERVSEARMILNQVSPASQGLEYRFLKSMADQSSIVLDSQISNVSQSIAVQNGGKLVAIGGADKSIYVCSTVDNSVVKVLSGHSGAITTLDFSPDGNFLISGSRDKTVRLWDIQSGLTLKINNADFSQGIYQVKFNPKGDKIGVVSWELKPGYGVNGFCILLNASDLGRISRQDLDMHPATSIVFHPNQPKCFIATWGEVVYGYTLPDWKLDWKYDLSDPSDYNAFNAIDLTGDGEILAIGSVDHCVHLLQAKDGKLLRTLRKNPALSRPLKTVDFHNDDKRLAVSGDDGIVTIWDIEQKAIVYKLVGHTGGVSGLKWINDSILVTVSQDTTIRSWNIHHSFVKEADVCGFGPWQLPVWQKKSWFVAPCSDEKLSIYDVLTGKQVFDLGKIKGLCGNITEDGMLATAGFNGQVSIFDLNSMQLVKHCTGHTSRVDGVAWLSDGTLVSVGDKTLRRWSKEGNLIDSLSFNFAPFRVVAKGSYIAVSTNQQIVVYESSGLVELARLDVKSGAIQEILFSPNGTYLSVFSGKNIHIFKTDTWHQVMILKGHEQAGYGMDFSSDEKYMLTGSYDQTLRFWDINTGQNTLTYHGINEGVYGCKFVGGHSIIASTGEGKVFTFRY